MKLVSVVLLNWNGWLDTIECLASLYKTDYPNYKIIVVDNGSTDESVSIIREAYPKIELIETGENLGFARGYNVGIRSALANDAQFVFVLNNDTVVAPDCISRLVEYAENSDNIALVGPKICDMDSPIYRQWSVLSRFNFFALLVIFSPFKRLVVNSQIFRRFFYFGDEPTKVYGIPGSAMLFKSGCLNQIGLFDEGTFLYWEEYIIAEKLMLAGLCTYVVPEGLIRHKENASISKIGAGKFIENVRSERYFFKKYLKMPAYQRGFFILLRILAYSGRCLNDRNYLRQFGRFIRVALARTRFTSFSTSHQ